MSGSHHRSKTPWFKRLLLWRAAFGRRSPEFSRSGRPGSSLGHDRLRTLLLENLGSRFHPLAGASALIIGGSLLSLSQPLLLGYLCDHILVPRNGALLLPFLGVAGGVWLAQRICEVAGEGWFFRLHQELQLRLQQRLIERVLRLPHAFFDAHSSGYLQTRIDEDMRGAGFLYSPALIQLFGQALQLLFGLGILIHLSPFLGAIIAIALVPLVLLAGGAGRLILRLSGRAKEARAQAQGHLQESLANQVLIKAEGAEQERLSQWTQRTRSALNAVWEQMIALSFGQMLTGLLPGLILATTLFLGCRAVISGTWSIGSFLAFLGTLRFVLGPAESLAFAHLHLQEATASWRRLAHLAGLAVEESPLDAGPVERLEGLIEFDRVSFAYHRRAPVLHSISVRLEPGQRVVLLGPSGAGKTTLVHLLMRLYEPTSGTIRFDGRPASSLRLDDLRRRIGFLAQVPQFFAGTILDNLQPAGSRLDLDAIRSLARDLSIDEPIAALPQGYATELGESGCGLSRGQLQRLALVRVLATDPDLLILDEPTSALDDETAALIRRALSNPGRSRTTLIIAHDRRTLEIADQVLFLGEDGTLRSGTMDGLAATDPAFRAHLEAV